MPYSDSLYGSLSIAVPSLAYSGLNYASSILGAANYYQIKAGQITSAGDFLCNNLSYYTGISAGSSPVSWLRQNTILRYALSTTSGRVAGVGFAVSQLALAVANSNSLGWPIAIASVQIFSANYGYLKSTIESWMQRKAEDTKESLRLYQGDAELIETILSELQDKLTQKEINQIDEFFMDTKFEVANNQERVEEQAIKQEDSYITKNAKFACNLLFPGYALWGAVSLIKRDYIGLMTLGAFAAMDASNSKESYMQTQESKAQLYNDVNELKTQLNIDKSISYNQIIYKATLQSLKLEALSLYLESKGILNGQTEPTRATKDYQSYLNTKNLEPSIASSFEYIKAQNLEKLKDAENGITTNGQIKYFAQSALAQAKKDLGLKSDPLGSLSNKDATQIKPNKAQSINR